MNYDFKYIEFELNLEQKKKIESLFDVLVNEAKPLGFIARADTSVLWYRHIIDSLLPLNLKEVRAVFSANKQVYDLGTGAGLPGLLLAIAFSDVQFRLIDSSQKKISFIDNICNHLDLQNVKALCHFIEKEENKKSADVIVNRAFQRPLVMLELSLAFLREHAKILYWRSQPFDTSEAVKVRLGKMGFHATYLKLGDFTELGQRGCYLFSYDMKNNKYPRPLKVIKKDPLSNSTL